LPTCTRSRSRSGAVRRADVARARTGAEPSALTSRAVEALERIPARWVACLAACSLASARARMQAKDEHIRAVGATERVVGLAVAAADGGGSIAASAERAFRFPTSARTGLRALASLRAPSGGSSASAGSASVLAPRFTPSFTPRAARARLGVEACHDRGLARTGDDDESREGESPESSRVSQRAPPSSATPNANAAPGSR
jgi:hypothetical protein